MTEEAQRKVDSFISLGYNLEVIYKEDMDKLDMGVGGYYGYWKGLRAALYKVRQY